MIKWPWCTGLKEPKYNPIRIDYQSVILDPILSTLISSASFNRKLKLYPATRIEMGSPRGAIFSTLIFSPGTQPISISFNKSSESSIETMTADSPGFNSLSFNINAKVVWYRAIALRILEMELEYYAAGVRLPR